MSDQLTLPHILADYNGYIHAQAEIYTIHQLSLVASDGESVQKY